MTVLDALLLVAGLALAIAWIVAPRLVGRMRWAPAGVAVLAAVQFVVEGGTWQFLPLYGLLALMAIFAARRRLGGVGRGALALGALASLGAWAILAVPHLPAPKGPYAVGSTTFRWVDARRGEDVTDDPADRRNVIVQAWYPSTTGQGHHSIYIDGLGHLPPSVNGLPRFVFRRFGQVDTHAIEGGPVSAARARWPVVIFSPGYGAPRAFYSSLTADLASRGFVVLALDHPYESAVTQLADGRVVGPIERFIPGDPDRVHYMELRARPRVADVRFVLDRISAGQLGPLSAHLDPGRVAVIGHSFGGATSALVLADDPRPRAGADLDGMLYGGVEAVALKRPFLTVESDHAVTHHPPLYMARMASLLARLGAPAWRYEVKGVGHLSFTDGETFFAPPARPIARILLEGSRPATETRRATADILTAFLRETLDGAPSTIAVAAAAHPHVVGGRVAN